MANISSPYTMTLTAQVTTPAVPTEAVMLIKQSKNPLQASRRMAKTPISNPGEIAKRNQSGMLIILEMTYATIAAGVESNMETSARLAVVLRVGERRPSAPSIGCLTRVVERSIVIAGDLKPFLKPG